MEIVVIFLSDDYIKQISHHTPFRQKGSDGGAAVTQDLTRSSYRVNPHVIVKLGVIVINNFSSYVLY